jgi:beta-galactosidase
VHEGEEMICSPVKPTLWRAPTDNDRRIRRVWEEEGLDKLDCSCTDVKIKEEENCISVITSITLGAKAHEPAVKATVTYTFSEGRPIKVNSRANVNESLPMLPRFGFEFTLPRGFENVKYFGYVPMESYVDKRLAARLSLFETTASANFEPYVKPQENSSHYGCRFAYVSHIYGHGLFFGAKEFSLSASHFTPEYLTATPHNYELTPRPETTVIIDYKNSGIGSNSCGPELLAQYRISEKEIDFTFSFLADFVSDTDLFAKWQSCIAKTN